MLRKILVTTFTLSAFIFAGCQKEAAQQQTPPPPMVVVASVGTEDITPSSSYIGKVDAAAKATITARVSGYLEARLVNEGDLVKKDQVIFTIEKTQYEAAVRQSEAALEQARANAYNASLQKDRAAALLKSASISQANYDSLNAQDAVAKANVAAAEAALASARLNVQYTTVTSPVAGKIGFINFNVGETVGPSSGPIATVIADDPMYVIFSVSDRQMQDIRQRFMDNTSASLTDSVSRNADLQLELSNGSLYPIKGTINFTDNAMVAATDSLRIRGVFPNPDSQLLQGQTVTVRLESKVKTNSIVIPQSAVLTDIGGRYVLVADADNTAQRRNIEVGVIIGSNQIVTSGLEVGERLIIEGIQKARPGAVVTPMTQAEYSQMVEAQMKAAQQGAGGQ